MSTKICLKCGEEFYQNKKNCRGKNWVERKYCSLICRPVQKNKKSLANLIRGFKIGQIPWNKGKSMIGIIPINDNNPNFIHGLMNTGYKRINNGNGKRKLGHRLILEEALGRELTSQEIVHHIDHNKLNNLINNLKIMTRSEHMKLHQLERMVV